MRPFFVATAVLGFFCFAALAPQTPAARATLVIVNGRVVTPSGATADAVAVDGNRIVAVGTTPEIERLRGPSTRAAAASFRGSSTRTCT
jgi:hypothetical protein